MAKQDSKDSRKGSEPVDWRRQAREIADSLAIAFILAMIIRHFVLEVFKIPTKSMQPTLLGDPWTGDKILVSKFAYDFKGPERWDVMVFKYPEDTSRNYIKRLAALPGETLFVRSGDVFIQADGSPQWQIARKRWRVQEALWRPRHVRGPDGESYWVPKNPKAWTIKGGQFAVSAPDGKGFERLEFGRPIYAYEDHEFRESHRPFQPMITSDIMVDLQVEPRTAGATVDINVGVFKIGQSTGIIGYGELVDEWSVRLAVGEEESSPQVYRGRTLVETGEPCALPLERATRVQVCHVDQSILVRVAGREVVSHPYTPKPIDGFFAEGQTAPVLGAKVAIGCAGGSVVFRKPGIAVDVYYTTEPHEHAVLEPYTLKSDEFFVLGDNSANSNDSRAWGTVPRRYLVGEAFLVLWPLGRMKLVR